MLDQSPLKASARDGRRPSRPSKPFAPESFFDPPVPPSLRSRTATRSSAEARDARGRAEGDDATVAVSTEAIEDEPEPLIFRPNACPSAGRGGEEPEVTGDPPRGGTARGRERKAVPEAGDTLS